MSQVSCRGRTGQSGSPSCDFLYCKGGLDCLANHCVDLFGQHLQFGVSLGRGVDVRASTRPHSGLGLFAERSFRPSEVVTTYDGHAVHCTRYPRAYHTLNEGAYSHFCTISGSEFVIAGLRYAVDGRGMGSFANHRYDANARLSSRLGCYPYLGHFGCVGLDMHVVVVATKTIHSNDEIFIRYSKNSCARLGIQCYE